MHVRAEKVSGGGPDLLGRDPWRLLVDGVPRALWDSASEPHGSNPAPIVQPGAADAWVAFVIPIDASELNLQAGDPDDPGVIAVELPPLP